MTKFIPGQKFKYKNFGTVIYTVTKVYNDGDCEAKDEEGDRFSFGFDELNQLEKVN